MEQAVQKLAMPSIGEIWPEQGGIYLGQLPDPAGTSDWHIVLAPAPAGELVDQAWGNYGNKIGGADSLSDGHANTLAMADAGSTLAAQILKLEIAGFMDWHLMSSDEARLAFVSARAHFETEWYWTSMQSSAHGAWIQTFGNGYQLTGDKDSEYRARAVRRFKLNP